MQERKLLDSKQLEIDLQYYKKQYEQHELNLNNLQKNSAGLLKDANNAEEFDDKEFRMKFSQISKEIDNVSIQVRELKDKIAEIEYIQKNRKEHLQDFLNHINEGKQGIPEDWLKMDFYHQTTGVDYYSIKNTTNLTDNGDIKKFTENAIGYNFLLEISDVTTRLSLTKSGIQSDNIRIKNTGNYAIQNFDGSSTVIVCHDVYVRNSIATVATEYVIALDKSNKPKIKLVSDKLILRDKNAVKSFAPEDFGIEENGLNVVNINEAMLNGVILKNISNLIDSKAENFSDVAENILTLIFKYSLLSTKNHNDWILLYNTLTRFLQIANNQKKGLASDKEIKIQKFLSAQREGISLTKTYFYQQAKNSLMQVFGCDKLSTGLYAMKQELDKKMSPLDYILFCQNEIRSRGENWYRSQETINLYHAVANIQFGLDKNGCIEVACLNHLNLAIDRYMNPRKNRQRLEREVQQNKNKYDELKKERQYLEVPIDEAKQLLKDVIWNLQPKKMLEILMKNKDVLLNLEKCFEENQINLDMDNYKLKYDFAKKELTQIVPNFDFCLDFSSTEVMIKNEDWGYTMMKLRVENTPEQSDMFTPRLSFRNQIVTTIINTQELRVIVEGSEVILKPDDMLPGKEILISIGNHPVRIIFENQKPQDHFVNFYLKNQKSQDALINFCEHFNNKTAVHLTNHFKQAPINKMMGNIKKNLNLINQDNLLSLAKLFSTDNMAEILESATLIFNELIEVDKLSASSEMISKAFFNSKPALQKLKEHINSLLTWYNTYIDTSYKTAAIIYLVNREINKVIANCDVYQFEATQKKIDAKTKAMEEVKAKYESAENVLQLILNNRNQTMTALLKQIGEGSNELNEDYQHWDVKKLSPIRHVHNNEFNFNCLIDVSEISAQLVLSRNGITHKVIDVCHDHFKVIDHKNSYYSVFVQLSLHDPESKDKPDVILSTEFWVRIAGDSLGISVYEDKIILCHQNAKNIFSPDDGCIVDKSHLALKDINEGLKNTLILREISREIKLMKSTPEISVDKILNLITQHSLLTSKNFSDWALLREVLTMFNAKLNNDILKLNNPVIQQLQKYIYTLSFYHEMESNISILFRPFCPVSLSSGLQLMKDYKLDKYAGPIDFVKYCQQVVVQRGSSWSRSVETNNLYAAILEIDDNKREVAWKNLSLAITQYQESLLKIAKSGNSFFGSGTDNSENSENQNRHDSKDNDSSGKRFWFF